MMAGSKRTQKGALIMNKVVRIFTSESAVIPFVAIVLGLLFGALVMLVGGYNPIASVWVAVLTYFGQSV